MDHKSIPDPPHSNPNYAFFYFLLPFFSQNIIKVRNLILLFLLCWIGAIYHKGSSISYVVSVGGEGGSPKDDLLSRPYLIKKTTRALCDQMDFTRTFEANTKCNNINYVWSHFYQILVVLKYHRRLWNNIFDTDIFRCINTHIKGAYLAFFGIFMLLEMSVSKLLFHRRLWYIRTTKVW